MGNTRQGYCTATGTLATDSEGGAEACSVVVAVTGVAAAAACRGDGVRESRRDDSDDSDESDDTDDDDRDTSSAAEMRILCCRYEYET